MSPIFSGEFHPWSGYYAIICVYCRKLTGSSNGKGRPNPECMWCWGKHIPM